MDARDAKVVGGRSALRSGASARVWALLAPRKGLLIGAFLLVLVGRVCGLALPTASKYLIDLVVGRREIGWLAPILVITLAATGAKACATYAVSQSLSKEAQRLIRDLRRRVQEHLLDLPVSFHDQSSCGALVARVMSDVEGVRNLLGTGLVESLGAAITAVIALLLLARLSCAPA